MYFGFGTKEHLQLKSIISIINHYYKIVITGNDFDENTSTKGVIYIDSHHRDSESPVIIHDNSFTNNEAYVASTAIFIRARGPASDDIYFTIPSNGDVYCGGYHIQDNYFESNLGCPTISGGVLAFECVNADEGAYDNDYRLNNEADSTWFENAYDNDFNYDTTYATEDSYTGIRVDIQKVTMKGNTYYKNFASGGKALVDFYGVPRIYFEDEEFYENGDSTDDVLLEFAEMLSDDADASFPYDIANYSPGSNEVSKGLISIMRASDVSLTSCIFSGNWIWESDYSDEKAQILTLNQLYGYLTINQIVVSNQIGMCNEDVCSENSMDLEDVLTDDQKKGSKFPLFKWFSSDPRFSLFNDVTTGNTYNTYFGYLKYFEDEDNTSENMILQNMASSGFDSHEA